MRCRNRKKNGFTLIEMIMVIVLLGIIAGILTPFISKAMQAYVQSKARADLVAKGRMALERIARDVRHAVPNTLAVVNSGSGIEYVRSRAGGRYVEQFDDFGTGPAKEFSRNNVRFKTNANRTRLYVVGNQADTGLVLESGDVLVIGNFSPADFQSGDSYVAVSAMADTTTGDDGTTNGQVITYNGSKQFQASSPGKHFNIASHTVEIGRLASDSTLRWHSVSGFSDYDSSGDWDNTDPVLVNGVDAATSFSYSSGTPQAAAVLRIDLQLNAINGDQSIRLYHEVVVRNTP